MTSIAPEAFGYLRLISGSRRMRLRIEKDRRPANASRRQGDTYSVFSHRILVAGVVNVKEWQLIDRKWVEMHAYWAWRMDVTISSVAAPQDLPHGGKTASLDKAIEKINEAWDLWVQYLGLAKTGT
ncbi:hypothetical protein G5V57_25780 [Nordella sp. HKS 07]|uniref:hypothetical protein n=1 Tax=Nordella sp. HKS 07 TaxID=2712222 RepID=UPI0013E19F9C|nr:hypothetical protein [Nordella sp. HKS 07]QIG50843.1 hypothetical protein G5V57_25780 [Nordella sp. HKS 07]